MQINDIVKRKSYSGDVIFKIREIKDDIAILEGVYIRLLADAKIIDLVKVSAEELKNYKIEELAYYDEIVKNIKENTKHITGKILHIDSDSEYLAKCIKIYNKLGISYIGIVLKECDYKNNVIYLIKQTNPDIVVLTGHDSFNKLDKYNINNYKNSRCYLDAIIEIRKNYSKDDIFIFAGACQSYFEILIAAGANFASSPKRILIDAYDPAIIASKAATTSFTNIISIGEILAKGSNKGAIGGIESYGKMRIILE